MLLALLSAPASAQQAACPNALCTFDTSSMRLNAWQVGLTLGGGMGLWFPLYRSDPGGERIPSDVTEPLWDPSAAGASDMVSPAGLLDIDKGGALVPFVGLFAMGVTGSAYADKAGHGVLAFTLVPLEATVLTLALTEVWKVSEGRGRPYTSPAFAEAYPDVYASEAFQEDLADGDSYKSMPSGHTSTSAAMYVSMGTTWLIHELENPQLGEAGWVVPSIALAGGLGLGALTGHLRVQAGKHHVDDVWVGFALGTAIGVALPVGHWAWSKATRGQDARVGQVRVRPIVTSNGLGLAGTFQ